VRTFVNEGEVEPITTPAAAWPAVTADDRLEAFPERSGGMTSTPPRADAQTERGMSIYHTPCSQWVVSLFSLPVQPVGGSGTTGDFIGACES
jgi:hypothetical protein